MKKLPPPWEAPLALDRPALPNVVWSAWTGPLDRLVAEYLSKRAAREPELVSDIVFARRAYLDLWGLPPAPDALQAFVSDRAPDKRSRLINTLLADNGNNGQESYPHRHYSLNWTHHNTAATCADNRLYRLRLADATDRSQTDQTVTGQPEGFSFSINRRPESHLPSR